MKSGRIAILILLAMFFATSCDNSAEEASALLAEAMKDVRLSGMEKKNQPRVFYYRAQALEKFERIEKEYPKTPTAKSLAEDGLTLGDEPYSVWKEKLARQRELIGAADRNLRAFTYATALVTFNPGLAVETGNLYADSGRIEDADAIWKTAETILMHTMTSRQEKSRFYKALAEGKRKLGRLDDAVRAAKDSEDELVMAEVSATLKKDGANEQATALLEKAFKSIRVQRREFQQPMLVTAVMEKAGISPGAEPIIQALIDKKVEQRLRRIQVERYGAAALYYAKSGDAAQAAKYFAEAEATAETEKRATRKYLLYLNLARLRRLTGNDASATKLLTLSREAVQSATGTSVRERDVMLVQVAAAYGALGKENAGIEVAALAQTVELRRSALYKISDETGGIAPLEYSVDAAKEAGDPLQIADALADLAGYEAKHGEPNQARIFWNEAIASFTIAVNKPVPAHYVSGGDYSPNEILGRRLGAMLASLASAKEADPEFYAAAFGTAFELGLIISKHENDLDKGRVLSQVTRHAPAKFVVAPEARAFLGDWLALQAVFFKRLYKDTASEA
jgi:tetratricopeptide (TPR) repeat protein